MRKLTQREKVLVAIVGTVCISFLALRILPVAFQGLAGPNIAKQRERLQTAENLVQLDKQANRIDERLRGLVGLQGRLISDSLFNEISQLHNVQALNQARQMSELIALHPALEGKAAALIAYKTRRGGFTNLEELKTIQGPIFEGEQPRVVIAQRISQLARNSGLKPDYQLNIKPSPGKKTEKILHQAKRNFVLYGYIKELEDEHKRLAEEKEQKEKLAEEQLDSEEELERAMFEGWWGDIGSSESDANNANGDGTQESVPMENEKQSLQPARSSAREKKGIDTASNSNSSPQDTLARARGLPDTEDKLGNVNLSFAQLPEIIPMELRVQLIEFILSFMRLELNGAAEFKRGFIADQMSRVDETWSRRFLEFGSREPAIRVGLREDSALLAKFEDLIDRYEATQNGDSDESAHDILDYEEQIMALTEYVDRVELQIELLKNWLTGVSLTYQPELYGVEIKFKSGIGNVVKLIELIDESTKWLYVRSLKIVNDKSEKKEDEERAMLNVELSLMARVL